MSLVFISHEIVLVTIVILTLILVVHVKLFAHFLKMLGQVEVIIGPKLNPKIWTFYSALLHLVSNVSLRVLDESLVSLSWDLLLLKFSPDPVVIHVNLVLYFFIFIQILILLTSHSFARIMPLF